MYKSILRLSSAVYAFLINMLYYRTGFASRALKLVSRLDVGVKAHTLWYNTDTNYSKTPTNRIINNNLKPTYV